jgi:hypothetical protein
MGDFAGREHWREPCSSRSVYWFVRNCVILAFLQFFVLCKMSSTIHPISDYLDPHNVTSFFKEVANN